MAKKIPFLVWIKINRAELDKAILAKLGGPFRLSDNDRRQWVLNDEGLHNWAKAESQI